MLNLDPGMQVLTVGCGIGLLDLEISRRVTLDGFVIGTDISAEQIMIANRNRENEALENIEFLQMEVSCIEHIPRSFDRIHCRYLLTHLPWEKVKEIIVLLTSKLAPGGYFLLEECATIDSLFCETPHPGYNKWKIAVKKQFTSQRSDRSPGQRILQYLQEEGYEFSNTYYQPVLSSSRDKSILTMGVQSASKRFLQENLCSEAELEEMIELLCDLEQDFNCFPRYNKIDQIIIKSRVK